MDHTPSFSLATKSLGLLWPLEVFVGAAGTTFSLEEKI